MARFDPADPFDDENPAADPRGEAPVATPARRRRQLAAPSIMPTNQLLEQAFPSWARVRAGDANLASGAAFRAGAGLALLDQILRANPAFAGALRQRLALRAAAACASMLRLREDASALRDAEHLAGPGADPGPAGRLHRLWRGLASESPGSTPAGFYWPRRCSARRGRSTSRLSPSP